MQKCGLGDKEEIETRRQTPMGEEAEVTEICSSYTEIGRQRLGPYRETDRQEIRDRGQRERERQRHRLRERDPET